MHRTDGKLTTSLHAFWHGFRSTALAMGTMQLGRWETSLGIGSYTNRIGSSSRAILHSVIAANVAKNILRLDRYLGPSVARVSTWHNQHRSTVKLVKAFVEPLVLAV